MRVISSQSISADHLEHGLTAETLSGAFTFVSNLSSSLQVHAKLLMFKSIVSITTAWHSGYHFMFAMSNSSEEKKEKKQRNKSLLSMLSVTSAESNQEPNGFLPIFTSCVSPWGRVGRRRSVAQKRYGS